jgi:hypothetical protein
MSAAENPEMENAMKLLKSLPVAMLLAAGWSCAIAAADFTTIRRTTASLTDGTPRLLVSFTLPANVNLSSSIANSAVLDLEALGSEYDFNEVYINPPTTVCTANSTDANQAGSIGSLQEHDDTNLNGEWATNHFAFSSGLLKAGTNQLMICIRSETGAAGAGVGNLDNVGIKAAVLHYHTN